MSLLSELIARLTALIEQSSESDGALQGAHDQLENTIGQLQAITLDSSSALVAEGLGQLRAGLEKIEEARGAMAGGNAAMEQYINGPLLGGGGGGGGGGGKPPGLPPKPAVTSPEPVSRPLGGSATRPSLSFDPERRPRGGPAVVEGTTERKRAIRRENESALLLSQKGYDVEQEPPTRFNGKNPDYLIQGNVWDCYAPGPTRSVDKIRKSIKSKVSEDAEHRQADRIILNLDDNPADPSELKALLQRRPIPGLQEIKIVRSGEIIEFYPFNRV